MRVVAIARKLPGSASDRGGMRIEDLVQGALALLAPLRCPACDLELGALTPGFCAACGPLLEPAPRSLSPPKGVAALYAYGGPLAVAIRRFKYGRRGDLSRPLSDLLLQAVPAYRGAVDRVVPVPIHPARLRERGYHHVGLMGRPLARALGVPLDVTLLRRTRNAPPQAGLQADRRRGNVRGAFAVVPRPSKPGVGRVLLLDDVRTSGATLAEAALTLQASGAATEVSCLSLATVV